MFLSNLIWVTIEPEINSIGGRYYLVATHAKNDMIIYLKPLILKMEISWEEWNFQIRLVPFSS